MPGEWVAFSLLAAYDGILRIKAGKLLTEPDPRDGADPIATLLGEVAATQDTTSAALLGILLAAALRAALAQALIGHGEARMALEQLLK